MINKFKITLIEALCIVKSEWRTEQEKELFDYATDIINNESKKQHLKYQLFVTNNKLEKYKDTSVLEFVRNYTKEKWVEIETDIDFSKYEPISTDSSLHVFEEKYLIDGKTYRLLYPIGDLVPPLIEILID